ncbi:MAG: ATP-binding cassette domain-containing protein [Ilumatobacteraceae bacterium]
MRQRTASHGLGILAPGESSRRSGLATVGFVMFVVFSMKYDNFLSAANMTTIALNVSSLAIAAVGTMALLVSGNVDLSIGSQYAFVAVVTATVVRGTSNPVLGVATALALGLVLGLLNGMLVVWLKISPLIVTLGMLAIYRGFAFLAGGGVSVYGFPSSFEAIGRTRWFGVPLPVIIAALVFLVGSWVLIVTVSGLRLFAIGGNRESARLVGLNVNRIVVMTFGMNGTLIGLVAALATAKLGSGAPNFGIQFEMAVLTAVILGGVAFNGGSGHPLGVLIGVCTIGILDAGLIFAGLQDWWQQISRGSLLILALISDQLVLAWKQHRSLTGKINSAPARRTAQDAPAAESSPVQPLADRPILLEATGLTVQYSGANVLEDAHLRVRAGEVVCLVGDNGAGKSSLIKAISGVVRLAAGTIELVGQRMDFHNPAEVRRAGIETVYQDLALCQNLGIAHNLVLGDEPRRRLFGVIPVRDDRAAVEIARRRLQSLGVAVDDFNRPVAQLSGGQRQSVAISRVLRDDVRLVILDEPTAALGVTQTAEVLRLVRTVAAAGLGVVLISHDVEDIFEVADRVVILQLGRVIFDGDLADLTRLELLRLMAGRERHCAAS